jgi:DNA-binding transcriptional LysR family regulator
MVKDGVCMNNQKLRYFVDVVDCGSFTNASKKNYISQTAISQHIASIEKELGFKLFERVKGKAELTRAGESFCRDCRIFLQYYDRAVVTAKNIANAQKGEICIGITGPTEGFFLPDVIRQFHKEYPNIEIVLKMDSFMGLKSKLESGELDVSFNFVYDIEEEKQLTVVDLFEVPVELLVSREHRFAMLDEINAIDVANETIIMLSRNYGPANLEHMVTERRLEGYEPQLKLVDSVDLMMFYVEINQGVAFIPCKFMVYNHDVCKMIHIRDGRDTNNYILAYKKTNINAMLPEFISIVKNVIENL